MNLRELFAPLRIRIDVLLTCLLMVLLLIIAPPRVHAQFVDFAPPPEPAFTLALRAGTAIVLTRGERREFAEASVTGTAPLPLKITAFALGELTGSQDGGSLEQLEPSAFRGLRVILGLRRSIYGPVSVGPIFAVTYSAEGKSDAPLQDRHYTAGGTVSFHYKRSYLHVGVGKHDQVGGGAFLAGLSVPTSKAVTSIDVAYPFARSDIRQGRFATGAAARSYEVRVHATVGVKDFK